MSSGLAIYDTMQFIKPDVSTICIGQAASMGAVLLAGGTKGKRFCLPHARMMIHQPLGGFQGQAADMEIHAREMLGTRDRLNKILAKHTGQSVEKIKHDTDRDNFMDCGRGDPLRPDRQGAREARRAAAAEEAACEAYVDGAIAGDNGCATQGRLRAFARMLYNLRARHSCSRMVLHEGIR